MNTFVDLQGASGQYYRFRRLDDRDEHLRIAGNFAVLKPRAKGVTVVFIGVTDDLSGARAACPPGSRGNGAHLYTRLNVSRAAREAEHADLLANYRPNGMEAGES